MDTEHSSTSRFEAFGMSAGLNPNNEGDMSELKAVLDSISQGKAKLFKKAKFQAFSAAISHEDHVIKVQEHLNLKCTNSVVAYRVVDPNSNTGISEGFDDDGEEGAGEKLLRLLTKMGIENIIVIVCVWHNNMPGHLGTDFYRMVLERARDLLTALHKEVLEQENQQITPYEESLQSQTTTKQAVESKIYNMAEAVEIGKKKEVPQIMGASDSHRKYIEGHLIEQEEPTSKLAPVSKDEYKAALSDLSKAGKSLTKSHIREFLSFVRPEPIIGKLIQVLAILKGYKNPNWVTCRDMLANPTFKLELMRFKGQDFDSDNVEKAYKIFESSAISFTQKSPRKQDFYQKFYEILPKISEGAIHIFDWIISFFKAYSGYRQFGEVPPIDFEFDQDPDEITLRTKMKIRKEQKKNFRSQTQVKQTPIKVPQQPDFVSPEGRADKEYYGVSEEQPNGEEEEEAQSPSKHKSTKKANIGIFLQNKQMMFGDDALKPQNDAPNPSLIDYNAFKRGGNFLIDEEEELRKREQAEQEKQDRKRMIMEKNSKFRVDNLPNKTEMMLETLKDIDYEEQPLETLIALAEKLKQKRLEMFPDTAA